MSENVVTVTVSAPVGSGKSMVLTEIEAALQVAGADVVWMNPDREGDQLDMTLTTTAWTCNCLQPGLGGDCDGSCQHPPPLFVACEFCQTEGRIYTQRGNHPDDVTDHGECPVCHGECIVEVEAKPATLEDMQNV